MRRFERLEGIAAALPLDNIDTDKILPGRFLKTVSRAGLGKALFAAMRYLENGEENPSFVLNREPWRNAQILVAGNNFGCGSSREHAPWALTDFGITCVIATGFADIFYNNCFKNGILPITVDRDVQDVLLRCASTPATASFCVNLVTQTIITNASETINFVIDRARKMALLEGRDEIAETLGFQREIEAWELSHPPLYPSARSVIQGLKVIGPARQGQRSFAG